MRELRRLGRAVAVIGDAVWSSTPGPEHRELFGDLPDGEDGIAEMAEAAGWTVVERARSSIDEWDEFEHGWIEGVRSIGTPAAAALADHRLEEYHQAYRGVLGFGWLFLAAD